MENKSQLCIFCRKKITWGGPQGAILNAELAISLGKELELSWTFLMSHCQNLKSAKKLPFKFMLLVEF